MLSRLIIKNYAIIPELDIAIQPGLTIITGETGAGKSILLEALGLALGRRADSKVLLREDLKCIVEAHFTLDDDHLLSVFEKEGLDFDRLLICRREISSGGRSRSFINDTPVSLKLMQEITSHLIELHHQHDNLALQSGDYQVRALDTISKCTNDFNTYSSAYNHLIAARNELARAQENEQSSARKKDFLSFQLAELEQAKLQPGEIASLEESQQMLEHAEAIDHVIGQLEMNLTAGQHSIGSQLTQLIKQIEGIRKVFPPIQEIADRLEAVRVEIQDLALESGRLEGPGQNDPSKLSKVQSRLNQLYSLIKKYQCTDDTQLIETQRTLQKEWSGLSSINEQIETLQKRITEIHDELLKLGQVLSKKRKTGAKQLIPQVEQLLKELGMPNAQFSVSFNALPSPGPYGLDEVTFLFSANKGMALQSIQSVASGGELSRFSLALKSIYAAQANLPTIIFDEIDTGISGEVALRMGQLIRSLAKGHQILMITHSPQIAAQAMVHYHVSKVTKNERDISSIQILSAEQRVIELAKMLSGDPPSKAALKNAEGLIETVKA
jgi:DNA repair protein RecN (Recombination protein N)